MLIEVRQGLFSQQLHLPAAAAAAAAAVLQNEPQLLAMLNEVRQGLFSQQTRQILASLKRPLRTDDGIEPTELFPSNEAVSTCMHVGASLGVEPQE
jgi:hypothetical protein